MTLTSQCTFLNFLPENENILQEVIFKDPCLTSITSTIRYLDGVIPDIEDTERDIQLHMGLNNFNMYTSDLEKALRSHKKTLTDSIIEYVKKEFPNVVFNKTMLTRFAFHMRPFNAETFVGYIRKIYADSDLHLLNLWQFAILSEMVEGGHVGDHWLTWREKTQDHIKYIDSAGIDLHCHGRDFYGSTLANYAVNFCKFVLEGRKTPLCEYNGWDEIKSEYNLDSIESGKAYSLNGLKSIRYYTGNHHLKLGFENPEDRQKFKDMLLTPAWQILNREEPEQVKYKDACDLCLYKDVLCFHCKDYSAWVGSCNACIHQKEYPGYRSQECDECSTGYRNNFVPYESVQHVKGLVKEDGYYRHTFKARKYKEELYLKVHCFERYYYYKHYVRGQYLAPVCSHCKLGVTEKEEGTIKQVCISDHKEKKYFVWNCRGTLAKK